MNSKHSMIDVCRAQFDQSIIDAAISQWRSRLNMSSINSDILNRTVIQTYDSAK